MNITLPAQCIIPLVTLALFATGCTSGGARVPPVAQASIENYTLDLADDVQPSTSRRQRIESVLLEQYPNLDVLANKYGSFIMGSKRHLGSFSDDGRFFLLYKDFYRSSKDPSKPYVIAIQGLDSLVKSREIYVSDPITRVTPIGNSNFLLYKSPRGFHPVRGHYIVNAETGHRSDGVFSPDRTPSAICTTKSLIAIIGERWRQTRIAIIDANGETFQTLEVPVNKHTAYMSAAFSPTGDKLYVLGTHIIEEGGSTDSHWQEARIFTVDVATGETLSTFQIPQEYINAIPGRSSSNRRYRGRKVDTISCSKDGRYLTVWREGHLERCLSIRTDTMSLITVDGKAIGHRPIGSDGFLIQGTLVGVLQHADDNRTAVAHKPARGFPLKTAVVTQADIIPSPHNKNFWDVTTGRPLASLRSPYEGSRGFFTQNNTYYMTPKGRIPLLPAMNIASEFLKDPVACLESLKPYPLAKFWPKVQTVLPYLVSEGDSWELTLLQSAALTNTSAHWGGAIHQEALTLLTKQAPSVTSPTDLIKALQLVNSPAAEHTLVKRLIASPAGLQPGQLLDALKATSSQSARSLLGKYSLSSTSDSAGLNTYFALHDALKGCVAEQVALCRKLRSRIDERQEADMNSWNTRKQAMFASLTIPSLATGEHSIDLLCAMVLSRETPLGQRFTFTKGGPGQAYALRLLMEQGANRYDLSKQSDTSLPLLQKVLDDKTLVQRSDTQRQINKRARQAGMTRAQALAVLDDLQLRRQSKSFPTLLANYLVSNDPQDFVLAVDAAPTNAELINLEYLLLSRSIQDYPPFALQTVTTIDANRIRTRKPGRENGLLGGLLQTVVQEEIASAPVTATVTFMPRRSVAIDFQGAYTFTYTHSLRSNYNGKHIIRTSQHRPPSSSTKWNDKVSFGFVDIAGQALGGMAKASASQLPVSSHCSSVTRAHTDVIPTIDKEKLKQQAVKPSGKRGIYYNSDVALKEVTESGQQQIERTRDARNAAFDRGQEAQRIAAVKLYMLADMPDDKGTYWFYSWGVVGHKQGGAYWMNRNKESNVWSVSNGRSVIADSVEEAFRKAWPNAQWTTILGHPR